MPRVQTVVTMERPRHRPATARWEEGVVLTTGHGSSKPLAHVDDLLQRALVLRGRHVMVLAHARRSLGINRSYDIILNRESSNIICNQFCRLQNQSEKRTAMAKFWSRTTGYVSDTLAASIRASGGTCTTRVRILGRYHHRKSANASSLCGRSSKMTSSRAAAQEST